MKIDNPARVAWYLALQDKRQALERWYKAEKDSDKADEWVVFCLTGIGGPSQIDTATAKADAAHDEAGAAFRALEKANAILVESGKAVVKAAFGIRVTPVGGA